MNPTQAVSLLRAAFDAGRLAQAYLVAGPTDPEGVELVTSFLEYVFCEARDGRPCQRGPCCRRVRERRHPDILWLEPEAKSRVFRVEQIRALDARVYCTAFAGGWKAIVFLDADRLGTDATQFGAANALLKTLEEPPPRTVFFLLTESPESLLPTILSRCQRLYLSSSVGLLTEPHATRLLELLQQPVIGAWEASAVAFRLLALLRELRAEAEAEVNAVCATETGGEEDRETREARIEARYRRKRRQLLRMWLHWQRDVLLLACGADSGLLYYPARVSALRTQAERITLREALARLEAAETVYRRLERHLPEAAVLEEALRSGSELWRKGAP